MEREQGKFIALEGVGKSGKSTQITRIEEYLRSQGREVVITREPGGVTSAEMVRETMFRLRSKMLINADQQVGFVFSARQLWLNELVVPAIENGKDVVTDRTYPSTAVYQGVGEGADIMQIEKITDAVMVDHKPDAIILFDITIDTLKERSREDDGGDPFDSETEAYSQKLIEGYKKLAKENWSGVKWYVIDGNGNEEEVFGQIKECLEEIFEV